jgi:alpha-tubulin suppressor-like RCC1 family protein
MSRIQLRVPLFLFTALTVGFVASAFPQSQVGSRQVDITIRGNDGATPGEHLRVGQTTRLLASVIVGYGPPGGGPRGLVTELGGVGVVWSVAQPGIASIDSSGRLTALRPGSTTVIARTRARVESRHFADGIVVHMPVTVVPQDHMLAGLRFASVAAASTSDADFTCATTSDGRILCFGDFLAFPRKLGFGDGSGGYQITNPPSGVRFRQVAVGLTEICALTNVGSAYCWGDNRTGELGTGSRNASPSPVLVAGGHRFTKLVVGRGHVCGLGVERDLYCWGDDSQGAIGRNGRDRCQVLIGMEQHVDTVPSRCSLSPIEAKSGERFRDVALGDDFTCGLTVNGVVQCWGQLSYVGAGPGDAISFDRLGGGAMDVCGLNAAGVASCWGRNWRGDLGGHSPEASASSVAPVVGGHRFRSLALGPNHTCGLTVDGRAYCWGNNFNSELGTGAFREVEEFDEPTAVAGGLYFRSVTTGDTHTCALTISGALYCWGSGLAVRPELGSLKEEPEPFYIAGPRAPQDHAR